MNRTRLTQLPRLTRVNAFVIGLVVLFMVAIVGIAILLDSARRTERLSQSEEQAQHFISGAEAAVNRSLLGIDVLLASVDNLLDLSRSVQGWIDPVAASRLIRNAMRQNLLVDRLVLFDADGNALASSDRDMAATRMSLPRDFLQDAFSQPSSGLRISAPVLSFQSSETVLFMGRTIRLGDGKWLLAVAEVPVVQLMRVLVQGADIEGLQATLERGNGELLLGNVATGQVSGIRLSPSLDSQPSWDHPQNMRARLSPVPAIVAVRATLYRNVFITASIPIATALRQWEHEALFINGVAAVMLLLIGAAGTFAIWYLKRIDRAQASIARGKEVLDQALGSMVTGFILLDPMQRVVTWNSRFVGLHPWLAGIMAPDIAFRRLVECTAAEVLPQSTEAERLPWVNQRMSILGQGHEERQVTYSDGTILEVTERPTPDGGVVIIYQDVTRLRHAIADVESLAFYDPLTGLPNRRLLNDRLQHGIKASLRNGRYGALLFLDLDHFKTLNDTSGHEMGDLLLEQVAKRLKTCVRTEDTVARLGGDEFVVMLQNLSDDPQLAVAKATRVGETILALLHQPYVLHHAEHNSSCSIGATLFGTEEQDASELLKQADIAMYQVKNSGRNGLCFFDPIMLAAITARADMERDLRHALDEQQFVVYFQIQVGDGGQPVGAEVLLRWQHPMLGLVAPGQFIGLAEETGLILAIGDWVLRTACQQLKAWERHPIARNLQLAVNVSARQFRSATFVSDVRNVLQTTGTNAKRLKLELTESLVLDNIDDTIAKMQELQALGVGFSIDDFGTGYSSLAYLTRLPLDQLKIDRSFVRNIGLQASDAAVIDSIIGLARSLELEVIAEGVETEAQRDFLAEHGCAHCQGYLFGHPLPIREFELQLATMAIPV